jgi:cytochrome c oxidase subunit 1
MALLMRGELAVPGSSSCRPSSTTSCSPCTARSCCCSTRRRSSSVSRTTSCRCRSGRRTSRSRGSTPSPTGCSCSAALIVVSGFLTPGGAADFGWFAYTPLSNATYSPGPGATCGSSGLIVSGLGTILGGVNFVTTVVCMRAPGMTMFRMPIFTWNIFITALLILIAFPILTAALFGAGRPPPRHARLRPRPTAAWCSGSTCSGSSAIPRSTSSRCRSSASSPRSSRCSAASRCSATRRLVFATIAIAVLSVAVWAHHMYATGAVMLSFFSFTTFLIAIPTGVKFVNWIGTMWKGKITFETPMLFSVGFLVTFLFGGLTGVLLGCRRWTSTSTTPTSSSRTSTTCCSARSCSPTFAGIYFWFPKMTGRFLDETLGKIHFWTDLRRLPHDVPGAALAGQRGHAPRYVDYQPSGRLHGPEHDLLGRGVRARRLDAAVLLERRSRATATAGSCTVDDPWGFGNSLEWATSSAAAAAQLHRAAPDPLRAPGVRPALPAPGRALPRGGARRGHRPRGREGRGRVGDGGGPVRPFRRRRAPQRPPRRARHRRPARRPVRAPDRAALRPRGQQPALRARRHGPAPPPHPGPLLGRRRRRPHPDRPDLRGAPPTCSPPTGRSCSCTPRCAAPRRPVDALGDAGFVPSVLSRVTIPFGPVMQGRAAMLEQRGLIAEGERFEELVVVSGMR